MSEIKQKTAHYRKCEFQLTEEKTRKNLSLQNLFSQEAEKRKKPWSRYMTSDGKTYQLLSHVVNKSLCVCGILTIIREGDGVPLIDLEAGGETWEEIVDPIDTKGKPRKVRRKELCFAIRENHVAIIQNTELHIGDLRDFLTWFLEKSPELQNGFLIHMENVPKKSAMDEINKNPVKKVSIHNNLYQKVPVENDTEFPNKKSQKYNLVYSEPIRKLLNVIMQDQPILPDLDGITDPGSISVGLEIKYNNRKEKSGQAIVKSIAQLYADSPNMNTKIELKGGKILRGEDLIICQNLHVQHDRNIMMSEDAMAKLADWLIEKIKNKEVI